jgi:hypothetical protein
MISPSVFRHVLEPVSSSWRSIMSMVPEFWTDLIIVVDIDKPFFPSDVQSFLEWSRTLPLHIFVTRRPGSRMPSAEEEKSFMAPLISILAPQLYRCQSFYFYAIHSPSLPLLGRDLCCAAPKLRRLKLESHVDIGGDSISVGDWCSLTCPGLTVLALNGQNIVNLASRDPGWFNTMERLRWLTISCLAPRPERVGQQLSVYQVSRMLFTGPFSLYQLTMKDVYLEHDLMSRRVPEGTLNITFMSLVNIKDSLIEALFRSTSLSVQHMHIIGCSLQSVRSIPGRERLTLEHIKSDIRDFEPLWSWMGQKLSIKDCPDIWDQDVRAASVPELLWTKLDNWKLPNNAF